MLLFFLIADPNYLCYFNVLGQYVTIEEFIKGDFRKFVNNDGSISSEKTTFCQKAECLVHFSFEKSNRKLMLLDIQGAGDSLCDTEIGSSGSFVKKMSISFALETYLLKLSGSSAKITLVICIVIL